jgi:NADPH:quinone reductase-like Zn-dependent oxidoreductase
LANADWSHVTRPQTLRPATGEVRISIAAIGVGPLGTQVAGTVDAVGLESAGFARGDRVTFRASAPIRGTRMVVPERELLGVPADVSLDDAVGVLPCAGVARAVVRQVRRIRSGDRVLVGDGAAAVGPYLAAWVEHLGASVVSEGPADATITATDIATACATRPVHGLAQQAAADVYAAIRAGVFAPAGPVGRVLHPTEERLAA